MAWVHEEHVGQIGFPYRVALRGRIFGSTGVAQGGEFGILNGPQWTQHPGAGLAPGDSVPPEWSGAAVAWGTPPAPTPALEPTDEPSTENGG